ncbi:hypothetical protein AAOP42_11215 [Reichenbachiella sp. MALMAid0571]
MAHNRLIGIKEMDRMSTPKPYTLPSRTSQPHKPKLVKEYGCPPHGGKPKGTIQNEKHENLIE